MAEVVEGATSEAMVFNGEIKTLPGLKQDGYTKDGLIQQAAIMLFANTNFETCGMTPESVAKMSVERAKLLVNELGL